MIQLIYPSLTKAEKKVADAIRNNPEESVLATINDLAAKAGVGETSVMRFCRKLGFKGYHEFKLSIAIDLVNLPNHLIGKFDESDDYHMLARKLTQNNERMIQETLSMLNMAEMKKAVKALLTARRIYVYGVVTSGTAAQDVFYRLMRIGMNVEAYQDSHIIAMTAALIKPDDVVLGISTSGSTRDIVDAFRKAKENGAQTIAVTSHADSALAEFTDIQLLVPSKEMPLQGGSFSTKIAQMHLLDILLTMVTMETKETAYSSIKKTAKAVIDKMT
jgi:DNA-binding MurR/RpiR family transcriptional regulator